MRAFRDRLHAASFQPFVVVLHSNERLRVKNPDTLTVTLSGCVIYECHSSLSLVRR